MQIINVLWSLFSEPHVVAFDTFMGSIASLKLNEEVSKPHQIKACKMNNEQWHYNSYSKVFIPPFLRALNSSLCLIPSKPISTVLKLHEPCIFLFHVVSLVLQLFLC
jgi:hypothetical protein